MAGRTLACPAALVDVGGSAGCVPLQHSFWYACARHMGGGASCAHKWIISCQRIALWEVVVARG